MFFDPECSRKVLSTAILSCHAVAQFSIALKFCCKTSHYLLGEKRKYSLTSSAHNLISQFIIKSGESFMYNIKHKVPSTVPRAMSLVCSKHSANALFILVHIFLFIKKSGSQQRHASLIPKDDSLCINFDMERLSKAHLKSM